MKISTVRNTAVTVSASLLVAAAGLVGAAVAVTGDVPDRDRDIPALEAPAYAGDPWESRFREQFWSSQHIHDSWNRCHLGENVPRRLQRGPGC